MKIFIAGGTGAVGKRLVPLLGANGHEVVGTTRSEAKVGDLRALGAKPEGALRGAAEPAPPLDIAPPAASPLARLDARAGVQAASPRQITLKARRLSLVLAFQFRIME